MTRPFLPLTQLKRWVWLLVPLLFGLAVGFSWLLFVYPLGATALVITTAVLFSLSRSFEQTGMCLLLLRSALDIWTAQQVPALFAITLNLLVLCYVGRQMVRRQTVQCDRFWWVLLSWVLLQGIWVVLLPVGGLGGEPILFADAVREWVRLFSLAMVYLLVMQLRGKVSPQRLATWLMLSLAVPLTLAGLQWAVPNALPPILQSGNGFDALTIAGGRIDSSLGHYNSFATFSLLFMALALWRSQLSRRPWAWWLLATSLLFCLLLSKSLTGMVMLAVFAGMSVVISLRSLKTLRGKVREEKVEQKRGWVSAIALAMIAAIVLTVNMGQPLNRSRLAELNQTPLMNSDLDFSRAIALQAADVDAYRNSFNWRLLQWHDLLQSWQRYPVMGHGLATTKAVSTYDNTSHNDYIRFLVEGGVIGLSLFLLFWMAQLAWIGRILRQSQPGSGQRQLAQMMMAFAVAMLVGMSAGNVMVHTATFFYWWVLMAILGWPWPVRAS
ncbi:MAG: O-antigen ligase family protein [Cyanobacteria bacterium P01_D01_bin.1]